MAATASPVILTPEDVARKLTVPVQTLYNWRSESKHSKTAIGPLSFKFGRLVRYYESDVDAWVEAQRALSIAS